MTENKWVTGIMGPLLVELQLITYNWFTGRGPPCTGGAHLVLERNHWTPPTRMRGF